VYRANTAGTNASVATVREQQTTDYGTASGAFCSPPSPRPSDIADADAHCERCHEYRPESSEARVVRRLQGGRALIIRSRAKLTTRILLAVATPMHIIAPVSAGTLRVVPVISSIQAIPATAPQCRDDDERIQPRLEVITMSRYTRMIAPAKPMPVHCTRPHGLHLAAMRCGCLRQLASSALSCSECHC